MEILISDNFNNVHFQRALSRQKKKENTVFRATVLKKLGRVGIELLKKNKNQVPKFGKKHVLPPFCFRNTFLASILNMFQKSSKQL